MPEITAATRTPRQPRSRGIERCERLAFVNRERQLKVEVKPGKEKYMPREKVTLNVKVTDDRGQRIAVQLGSPPQTAVALPGARRDGGHRRHQHRHRQERQRRRRVAAPATPSPSR